MANSTVRAPSKRRNETVVRVESFSYEGFLTAPEHGDPRSFRSGLQCPSFWVRLFRDQTALIDAFCTERKLHRPEELAAIIPTFQAVYVRTFDVLDLDVVRIPRHERVSTHDLHLGGPDREASWSAVCRCMNGVADRHPAGVIVQDDPVATSIFISLSALDAHTRLDRLEPVPLAPLLAARAECGSEPVAS